MARTPRLVVPVQLTAACATAAREGRAVLGGDVELHIVLGIPAPSTTSPGVLWGAVSDEARRAHATDAVAIWMTDERLTGRIHIAFGQPAAGILQVARTLDADLIAMAAARPKGPVLFGGVTEQVVRTAHCPVWVSRPAAPPA